jgi:hypothetical protein
VLAGLAQDVVEVFAAEVPVCDQWLRGLLAQPALRNRRAVL